MKISIHPSQDGRFVYYRRIARIGKVGKCSAMIGVGH